MLPGYVGAVGAASMGMMLLMNLSPAPKMSVDLKHKVCVVTGASRGIGRGIALALGEQGATVYATGRSAETLRATTDEVTARGGRGVPVVCDHESADQIKELFERVGKVAQDEGKLHLLVNNCFAGVNDIFSTVGEKKFWEKGPEWWDKINSVGLRAHFLASQYAVPLMIPEASEENPGLIVTVSSWGGSNYLFDVAYGVGKAAKDRLAKDMGVELKDKNIASVALWPGAVKTEFIKESILDKPGESSAKRMFSGGESTEYAGRAVASLARDQGVMKMTCKTLLTVDLADKYGFTDVDGSQPEDFLRIKTLVGYKYPTAAKLIPRFLKVPKFVVTLFTGKF